MKRTIKSLVLILTFVVAISILDICFVSNYICNYNRLLDSFVATSSLVEKQEIVNSMNIFYKKNSIVINRFVPVDHMEEIETLMYKLNSYLETEDASEINATVMELRARVNLLYSGFFYHWYHPEWFGIE